MAATSLPLQGGAADEHPLLRTLFRQSTTGVALLSYDGRYVAANDAFCEVLGRTERELVGLSWRDVTHPDDVAAGERAVIAIQRGDELELKGVKRYVRPDGNVRWAMLGTSLVQDDAGRPVGFLSQVLDVTGHKRAEATLRAERGLLELLTAVTLGLNEGGGAERALRVALNAVCAHTGWRIGHAVRLDGGRLVTSGVWVAAEPAAAEALRDALTDRPADDRGAAAEAVRARRHVWVDDLDEHPAAGAWRAAGVQAVGAWPVSVDGEVVAVLEFGAGRPDRPAEPLVNVLTSLSSQLGQAHQRMQTLERLSSSQRQLSEAQAVAGLGSWRWDIDTGAVAWSDQFFRLLGREPQSVAPSVEWLIAHVHEDDRERVCSHIEHTLVSGERLDLEFRLVCADGQVRTVLAGGQVATSDDGRGRRFVGYLQDITARAEVQAALTRSEERVRLILQTSSDAFVEFDRDWVVAEWNRAAECLFGWSRAEAVGQRIDDLLATPAEAGEHLLATLTRLDSPALDAAVEATARHRDGRHLPIEVTIPRTPDSVLRSTFIRDISERKGAERALQESNASLRDSLSTLERRSGEVAMLNEMIDLLQSAGEAAEGYRVIAQHAASLFPEASGTVYVAEHADSALVAVADWGGYGPLERTLARDDCWALRRGRLVKRSCGDGAV
jgi:PAS domain S-box-containing protein